MNELRGLRQQIGNLTSGNRRFQRAQSARIAAVKEEVKEVSQFNRPVKYLRNVSIGLAVTTGQNLDDGWFIANGENGTVNLEAAARALGVPDLHYVQQVFIPI